MQKNMNCLKNLIDEWARIREPISDKKKHFILILRGKTKARYIQDMQ